jgi:hypothetical protein
VLIAEAAPGRERVGEMRLPRIRHFIAQGNGDRHLRHYGCASAADQAAIDEQHFSPGLIGGEGCRHAGRPGANDQKLGRDVDPLGHTRNIVLCTAPVARVICAAGAGADIL